MHKFKTQKDQYPDDPKKNGNGKKHHGICSGKGKWIILLLIGIIAAVFIVVVVLAGVYGHKRAERNRLQRQFNGLYGTQYTQKVMDILGKMSQEEKIGQLIQTNKGSLGLNVPQNVSRLKLGSVLSAGGEGPIYPQLNFNLTNNGQAAWLKMTNDIQATYKNQQSQIPVIYAIDGVHGHNSVGVATIFPHNIAMGCANDTDLLTQQGRVTAEELRATGILWSFGPFVSVPDDIRWGRTYEGYSQDVNQNARLGVAYLKGAQSNVNSSYQYPITMSTTKHFIADGQWIWNYGVNPEKLTLGYAMNQKGVNMFYIDEGQYDMSDDQVKNYPGVSHKAMIDNGVMSVMISYGRSKQDNISNIINPKIVNDLLRKSMGFKGIIITDYEAVNRVYPTQSYDKSLLAAWKAGVQVFMVSDTTNATVSLLTDWVKSGTISKDELDSAVKHILEVKLALNLFEHPITNDYAGYQLFNANNQQIATTAVEKSLVLLQNNNKALPLQIGSTKSIGVFGWAANNTGAQCGGWTLSWQGGNWTSDELIGYNILQGVQNYVSSSSSKPTVEFVNTTTDLKPDAKYDVGIYVIPEFPMVTYSEGYGDMPNPTLSPEAVQGIAAAKKSCTKLIAVLLSGRPVQIDPLVLQNADAVVAAWLPGNLGGRGITNVLFGTSKFSGKLSFQWPKSFDGYNMQSNLKGSNNIQYDLGYGLTY